MRIAVLIIAALVAGCASLKPLGAGNSPALFVEATGYGPDRSAALQEAFKDAIQKTYGVLITTESRVENDRLTKDVINEYSSAIITKYDVLAEGKDSSSSYKVTIGALVSSNKLMDYVLANTQKGGANKTDGSQIYAQISTALKSKRQGDSLIQSIVSDFPRPALKASVGSLNSRIDLDRQVFLRIPYKIEWNKSYLESFQEIVEYVSTRKCPAATDDQYKCQYDISFIKGYWSWSPKVGYKLADNLQVATVRRRITPNISLKVNFLNAAGLAFDSACMDVNLTQNQKTGLLITGPNNSGSFAPLVWDTGQFIAIGEYTFEGTMEISVSNIQAIDKIRSISAQILSECSR